MRGRFFRWSGVAFDPDRRLVVSNTNRLATIVKLVPGDQFHDEVKTNRGPEVVPRERTPYGMILDWLVTPQHVPCNPPPWGACTAVDRSPGRIK